MKKTVTVITNLKKRYHSLGTCAINSFKKWNPEIDIFIVNDETVSQFNNDKIIKKIHSTPELINMDGILNYARAYCFAKNNGYEKLIILGGDTITCDRLDEFLDNDEDDVLATLNYPMPEIISEDIKTGFWEGEEEDENGNIKIFHDSNNLNADVICFNNLDALKEIIEIAMERKYGWGEQGGLNEIFYHQKYLFNVVDGPYPLSKVVYNARSKGTIGTNMFGPGCPATRFFVNDNKLYTEDGHQIKVGHYIEGIAGRPDSEFENVLNTFIFNVFNEDTKRFFSEHCGCGDFFNHKYDMGK